MINLAIITLIPFAKDSIHGWWIGSEIDKARLEFIKNNL